MTSQSACGLALPQASLMVGLPDQGAQALLSQHLGIACTHSVLLAMAAHLIEHAVGVGHLLLNGVPLCGVQAAASAAAAAVLRAAHAQRLRCDRRSVPDAARDVQRALASQALHLHSAQHSVGAYLAACFLGRLTSSLIPLNISVTALQLPLMIICRWHDDQSGHDSISQPTAVTVGLSWYISPVIKMAGCMQPGMEMCAGVVHT